jgi:hypothetical protein
MVSNDEIRQLVNKYLPRGIQIREFLHANPELG